MGQGTGNELKIRPTAHILGLRLEPFPLGPRNLGAADEVTGKPSLWGLFKRSDHHVRDPRPATVMSAHRSRSACRLGAGGVTVCPWGPGPWGSQNLPGPCVHTQDGKQQRDSTRRDSKPHTPLPDPNADRRLDPWASPQHQHQQREVGARTDGSHSRCT